MSLINVQAAVTLLGHEMTLEKDQQVQGSISSNLNWQVPAKAHMKGPDLYEGSRHANGPFASKMTKPFRKVRGNQPQVMMNPDRPRLMSDKKLAQSTAVLYLICTRELFWAR